MNNDAIEQQIQAKGLTAPRITPAQIEATIVREDYHRFPGTTVTVCCLTLKNGYNTIGESACVSPENFDADLGKRIARDRAREKIWALEGYLLRNTLPAENIGHAKPQPVEQVDPPLHAGTDE